MTLAWPTPERAREDSLVAALWSRRALVLRLARKELVVRYAGSRAGFLWFVLSPLLVAALLVTIFGRMARFETPFYAGYVVCGYVTWDVHSAGLRAGTASLRDNGNIVRKIAFPRAAIPLSVSLSFVANLCGGLVTTIAVALAAGARPSFTLLAIPLVVAVQLAFSSSLGVIAALLCARYRDVRFIVDFLLLVWFYATPVFYPAQALPSAFRLALTLNPMATIIDAYRTCLGLPNALSSSGLAATLLLTLSLASIAVWTHRRLAPSVADHV